MIFAKAQHLIQITCIVLFFMGLLWYGCNTLHSTQPKKKNEPNTPNYSTPAPPTKIDPLVVATGAKADTISQTDPIKAITPIADGVAQPPPLPPLSVAPQIIKDIATTAKTILPDKKPEQSTPQADYFWRWVVGLGGLGIVGGVLTGIWLNPKLGGLIAVSGLAVAAVAKAWPIYSNYIILLGAIVLLGLAIVVIKFVYGVARTAVVFADQIKTAPVIVVENEHTRNVPSSIRNVIRKLRVAGKTIKKPLNV